MPGDLKIFGGRAHPALVQEICEYLNLAAGNVSAFNFSDGEIFCQIDENVRGSDVFVVQPTCEPVNENLMELLILLDTLQALLGLAGDGGDPVLRLRPAGQEGQAAGADHRQAGGRPDLARRRRPRADHGPARRPDPGLLRHPGRPPVRRAGAARGTSASSTLPDLVIVSPDAGGVERARAIAKRLGVGLAIVDKRRTAPNATEVMHIIGDVEGCNALVVDDIIDTAGTLTKTVEALKAKGARRILAAGTHGVLSGPALARINDSPLESVLITNTIPVERSSPARRSSGRSRSRRSSARPSAGFTRTAR